MKKFLIEDGISIIDGTGPGQYTLMVYSTLKNLGYDVELPRKKIIEKIKITNFRRICYLVWLNLFFFLKLLFMPKGTIVIYTNYSIPFIKIKKITQIPVVHDLCSYIHPDTMTKIQNFYSRLATDNAIKNGDKIITVSKTVKEEIIRNFKINADKVFVVNCTNTLGLEQQLNIKDSDILQRLKIANKDYLMSVSTFNKRKNVMTLIESFNSLNKDFSNLKLVLVGRDGNDAKIKAIKRENDNIIFSGFVSDKELSILYKNAKLYIFPSIYEGFGIPIIDAQAFGVPVLCSDIQVFREIAGEGAVFCEPFTEGIKKGLIELLNNQDMKEELIKKGFENVKRFSHEVIKEQLKKVLEI